MITYIYIFALLIISTSSQIARNVKIVDQDFVIAKTNEPIVLRGPNVVVKGPPYLPSVEGDSMCKDVVDEYCSARGNCTSCTTFNQADVDHIKSMGWNFIRLGVVWAGAQPSDEDKLDEEFVRRLHDILNLTDRNNIHVMLDNHGDMVGSAGCGNGVPMWIQQKAAPELIGKPLETGFPYYLVPQINIKKVSGYDHCGDNETLWAKHAGDPNYNILNECCLAMNGPNPGGLGYTKINQKTMDYVLQPGEGRDYFVRYWELLTKEVASHESAFAIEAMNEPMSIRRKWSFDTWRAISNAVTKVVPDISVALMDVGEGSFIPSWATKYFHVEDLDISKDTLSWIRESRNLFYAFHWYGGPPNAKKSIEGMLAIQKDWNVPSFATEFMDCDVWTNASSVGISHSYWHYSDYCTTAPEFGNRKIPEETFGACILGWGGGNPSKSCSSKK